MTFVWAPARSWLGVGPPVSDALLDWFLDMLVRLGESEPASYRWYRERC